MYTSTLKLIQYTTLMKDLPLNNIFIPAKAPSKKLMIILHGRGDSSAGFTWLPPYLDLDDMNYLLLDAPYDYFGGRSWYDLPPNQLEGIVYSSSILADILDGLFEEEFSFWFFSRLTTYL